MAKNEIKRTKLIKYYDFALIITPKWTFTPICAPVLVKMTDQGSNIKITPATPGEIRPIQMAHLSRCFLFVNPNTQLIK